MIPILFAFLIVPSDLPSQPTVGRWVLVVKVWKGEGLDGVGARMGARMRVGGRGREREQVRQMC